MKSRRIVIKLVLRRAAKLVTILFDKMQGIGNDFVVMDSRSCPEVDAGRLAIQVCDRHTGIGADGLLLVYPKSSDKVTMQMFNPDGTPDVCGNGMRCVARYAVERLGCDTKLTIETVAGEKRAVVHSANKRVTVDMGKPVFEPSRIPVSGALGESGKILLESGGEIMELTPISTGSTHAVVFVDSLPDDVPFFRLSRLIEHHPMFPARTSVMWAHVINRGLLEMRIWERGVGETLGCGTGACAAAVAAIRQGKCDREVQAISKGGRLDIQWDMGASVRKTGPAEWVFSGALDHSD